MTTPPLTCRELVELVSDHLEGALSAEARERLESHLAECPDCTEYVRQVEATIAITGRLRTSDLPDTLRATLLSATRDAF